MASRRTPAASPSTPAFDLDALRAVKAALGAVSREDGEVFTFAPDVDAVASWLAGGVPFQIPLGAPREVLGDLAGELVDDWATVLGAEQRCADPTDLDDATELDVNDHFNHHLSVCAQNGALVSVQYRLHAWTLSDQAVAMHRGRGTGYVDDDGAILPRHDNRRFRALIERSLPAAGFPLKAPPAHAGKKERKGESSVRVTWRRRQETMFDSLELDVLAWRP